MGQSLVKNYIHIIFSTKHRQKLILPSIENELFAYLVGICNELECKSQRVGGYLDHIHIVCRLSQKIALMKLMEVLKSHSSKWIKTKGKEFENFFWQNGYGAFSVKPSEVDKVIKYIENQKEHHEKKNISG